MSEIKKEVIISKKQREFYKTCYAPFGYTVESEEKKGQHYTLVFKRQMELSQQEQEKLNDTEEKLRMIELIDRKKYGFNSLFFNLMLHIIIFCVQAFIFSQMNLTTAHPGVMLRTGIVILQLILIFGFCIKMKELFRWNVTQKKLKEDVLNLPETMEEEPSKEKPYYISVLFTRGAGRVSDLIYLVSGRQYTHSAIGLGTATDCFYSFNYRGFRTEHPAHRPLKNGKKNSLCYQFRVTEEDYRKLEKIIQDCLREKEQFHYNYSGTVFCILHIYLPFKMKNHYFCSEFVSEQLRKLDSFSLKKQARMYHPTNLAKVLSQQNNLCKVMVNEI